MKQEQKSTTIHLPHPGARLEKDGVWAEVFAIAHLPTQHGVFDIVVFKNSLDNKEHIALIRGDVSEAKAVPARLHSECLTGDVLGSLRCDCRNQLEQALERLAAAEHGVLLYMRQEGRGIGLGQKIRAYALQEKGLDTFEANEHLGFDADLRDYRVASLMLKLLNVGSIELATNNPAKISGLEAGGIKIARRQSALTEINQHNQLYVEAKTRAGHLFPHH